MAFCNCCCCLLLLTATAGPYCYLPDAADLLCWPLPLLASGLAATGCLISWQQFAHQHWNNIRMSIPTRKHKSKFPPSDLHKKRLKEKTVHFLLCDIVASKIIILILKIQRKLHRKSANIFWPIKKICNYQNVSSVSRIWLQLAECKKMIMKLLLCFYMSV